MRGREMNGIVVAIAVAMVFQMAFLITAFLSF
jgi:hypothetical protein